MSAANGCPSWRVWWNVRQHGWSLWALQRLFPEAAIEEVGDRRELVIYTGLSTATFEWSTDTWTEQPLLVPMTEDLD